MDHRSIKLEKQVDALRAKNTLAPIPALHNRKAEM
jgi:hypothetical protein